MKLSTRAATGSLTKVVIGLTATALVAVGCGTVNTGGGKDNKGTGNQNSGGGTVKPIGRLQVIAPASPGGGWDQTARSLEKALEDGKLTRGVQVSNISGAGGTVGLGKLATEKNPDVLMVTGLVMVGAVETNKSQARLENATPIARLTSEDEIVVVPSASPYKTIDDLIADAKAKGKGVAIAGGSAGGTDHILAGLIYQKAGVDPAGLNYIPYSGGGESLAALLGNKVAAGISGVGEYSDQIKAGKLRPLAVSGSKRVNGIDAPTLKEAGVDVELTNWRGIIAPPGIDDAKKQQLIDLATKIHDSKAWKAELQTHGWTDYFLAGKDFESFLKSEITRTKTVLQGIGLVK